MLGIGGKFASSKGMVAMPNLLGLTRLQAIVLLEEIGLKVANATGSSTSNQADNDKVFSQSYTAGELVNYETPISFVHYTYVAPPVPQGPTVINVVQSGCVEYERYEITNQRVCDTSTKLGSITYGFRRHNVTTYFYSDGSQQNTVEQCTDSTRYEPVPIYNCDGSLDCNSYLRTYSETRAAGNCSSGYGNFTIGVFREGCGKNDTSTFNFCTSNPNAVDCSSCVSSYTYRTSDSGCASGTAWRSVCTHPSGCNPGSTDVKGGCDPVVETVCRTSCTPWYTSSCNQTTKQRFVTRRCSDCNGNNEYRETYYEDC